MNKLDTLHMNEFYNEPEILLVEDINELEKLASEKLYEHETKSEHLLNQEIETDYHNTYYKDGKYGHRTLRMSNKEWHALNAKDAT